LAIGKLNPRFVIDGETYVMATQRMRSIGIDALGPVVAELSNHADAITAATDFAFQGF
jgi:toxin CcdB